MNLDIPTASVFRPLLEPSRYKGAHGGRGSGKSHFFAECAVEWCVRWPGSRIVCVREVQRSLRESVKLLIEDKIEKLKVPGFEPRHDHINTPGNGLILFQGMADHTAESVKSLEGFDVGYVEEAQTMTQRSLEMLRPTIRKDPEGDRPGSELWFSWNPRHASDPVDQLLRGDSIPPNAIVVNANYKDNPFFPQVLEEERAYDEVAKSLRYGHVWLGEYEQAVIGAFWGEELATANREGRITTVAHDRAALVHTWCDIGYTDAQAFWFVQLIGNEVHLIDYYEASGNSPEDDVAVLDNKRREFGYTYGRHIAPHDMRARTKASRGKQLSQLYSDLGIDFEVQPQFDVQVSIATVRQMLNRCWFDERKCEKGLDALRAFRKQLDEDKSTEGRPYYRPGYVHDWSSHGSSAFYTGAMTHFDQSDNHPRDRYSRVKRHSSGWAA